MKAAELTAERLRELLDYDTGTGVFRWRVDRRGMVAGSVAGRIEQGYVRISIDGSNLAHRLAWLYVTGQPPPGRLVHIDGDPSNNAFDNLCPESLRSRPERAPLTATRLRELLHYEPETGVFRRLVTCGSAVAGALAGSVTDDGYLLISIDGRHYLAHRLAFLYVTGAWPLDQIDHINGVRDDNRIVNLRDASRSLNSQNQRRARSGSRSGVLGAHVYRDGRWQAQIGLDGKVHHLGYFATPESAHAAYVAAKRVLHPGGTL